MTPTFAADRRGTQKGLTLVELLVSLALLAALAAMAAGAMRASSPRLDVRGASERLIADIKRARLQTTVSQSEPVSIMFYADGYSITALGLERPLPHGVTVSITTGVEGREQTDEIILGPSSRLTPYHIDISKNGSRSVIAIDAITRRVSLQ